MEENWRPVVGYEGLYEVSDCGHLRRVGRAPGTRPGYPIRTPPNSDGYPQCVLHDNGIKQSQRLHKLVAAAFLGSRPSGAEINHIDGDKTNNVPSNLEYVTHQCN